MSISMFCDRREPTDPRLQIAPNVRVITLPRRLASLRIAREMLGSYDVLFYMQPGLAEDIYLRWLRSLEGLLARVPSRIATWVEGDVDAYDEIPTFLRDRMWRVIAASDLLVAITPFVASQLEARGHEVSAVIPVGVDTQTFRPAGGGRKQSGEFSFVTVGSLKKWKQLDVVLDTARWLPEASFHVVGDGPERSRLEASAPGNVSFHGSLPQDEVIRILHRSDALLHASRREGMPKAVLEAMACGLPVLLLNHYGAESFISHGRDGMLARSNEELVSYARSLVESPETCESIGRAARDRALEFDWNVVARRWEDLLGREVEQRDNLQASMNRNANQ